MSGGSKYDRPHTHTQFMDGDGVRRCDPDRHHFVWDDDDTLAGAVCTRCGESDIEWDEWEDKA